MIIFVCDYFIPPLIFQNVSFLEKRVIFFECLGFCNNFISFQAQNDSLNFIKKHQHNWINQER